jgi:hypothetical protein
VGVELRDSESVEDPEDWSIEAALASASASNSERTLADAVVSFVAIVAKAVADSEMAASKVVHFRKYFCPCNRDNL